MNVVRLLALTLCVASTAAAAEYSDLYIIPVAGHVRGAFGTSWRSDLALHNLQMVPIEVELVLVESGRSPSTAPVAVTGVHLLPGETRMLADVLGDLDRDLTGALIIGAELPFAVTSRTWAELPNGRTLGQTVAPVALTGTANDAAALPFLTTDARQRSNLGLFAAASHAPLVVELELLSESGASLGSQVIVAGEPGFIHRQLAIPPSDASVTAIVRILEGDGIVVPYASIVDNATAEAAFVSGEPVSLRGAATLRMVAGAVE
jgi:hypothetical protein